MSKIILENDLPDSLPRREVIRTAYPSELAQAEGAIARGLSLLVECDKGMTSYIYQALRERLGRDQYSFTYIDGRAIPDPAAPPMMPQGPVSTMLTQIRDAVRGGTMDSDEKIQILVLPHLDLLTSSSGGLTQEAKEAIILMYENPNTRWIGFRDTSFTLPTVIGDLFPNKVSFLGVPRDRLARLVTKSESRKLGRNGLDFYKLYKNVSGINAMRLRALLESLDGEDYPTCADPIWEQIRIGTIEGNMKLPDISLKDIGGYEKVKGKIQSEIIDLLKQADDSEDTGEIEEIEGLLPRGMLFEGPPGTGKTMFAKAIAAELGAAVQIVNGPELKSKWVGESEQNLRQIFAQARASAPSLIVFDELDSFAGRRDGRSGSSSGVEHSMVNQLLTEMDGFQSNELVFIIGTTNFVESIDPALLRPGRFEFHLTVPYPEEEDREAILKIYNEKFRLKMTPKALEDAVRCSSYPLPTGGMWSGDHLQALCRSIARNRIRSGAKGKGKGITSAKDVEIARKASQDIPELNDAERLIVATHECGHAIVALDPSIKELPSITRISIGGDISGALGFVEHGKHENKNIQTHGQLYERIVVLFGGILAEELILNSKSIGSGHDLLMANRIARALVVGYGFSDPSSVIAQSSDFISDQTKRDTDDEIRDLLRKAHKQAKNIISQKRDELLALREELISKEVIDIKSKNTPSKPKRKKKTKS